MTFKDWEAVRRAESPDPDALIRWSVRIRENVDAALNMDVLQSTASDALTIEVQELQSCYDRSDKRRRSSEDTGLLHNAGVGVREDQRNTQSTMSATQPQSLCRTSEKNICCIELFQQLSEHESGSNQTTRPETCAG